MRRREKIEAKERGTKRSKYQNIATGKRSLDKTKEPILSDTEQTIVSVLARITSLPAIDLYRILNDQLPNLTWQNLQDFLAHQERAVRRISQEKAKEEKEGLPASYMVADVIELCFNEHKHYLLIAADQKSLLLFAEVLPALTDKQMTRFFNDLFEYYPYSLTQVENVNGHQIVTSDQLRQLTESDGCPLSNQEWINAFPKRSKLQSDKQLGNDNKSLPCNDLTVFMNQLTHFVLQYNVGKVLTILDDNTPYGDVVRKLNDHHCYNEAMEYFIWLYLRFPDHELKDQQISSFIRNQLSN